MQKHEEEYQYTLEDLDIWCGRTSPERSVQDSQKEQTSRRSSKKSSKSANPMPLCVCVSRIEDGLSLDVTILRMDDGALLGDYTMHSFGESPSEENVSRLSQILQDSAPQKYCLSAAACTGILRRAAKRGKELPEILRNALESQIARGDGNPQD